MIYNDDKKYDSYAIKLNNLTFAKVLKLLTTKLHNCYVCISKSILNFNTDFLSTLDNNFLSQWFSFYFN